MQRALRALVPLAASVVLLGACGGSSDDSSEAGSLSTPDKGCSLAPVSLVNSALGTAYEAPEVNDNGSVIVCTYASADKMQNGIVRFESGTPSLKVVRDGFAASNQATTDVAGLGDEAFSSTSGGTGIVPKVNTVVARKGDKNVQIVSQAPVDAEKALAGQLLAKY